jgi:bifunctional non-homologous end joining protein LigD
LTRTAPRILRLSRQLSRREKLVIWSILRLIYCSTGGEDLRSIRLVERKGRLQNLTPVASDSSRIATSNISNQVATRCCGLPASCTGRASSPSRWMPPYQSGRADTWAKSKCRAGHEVAIGGYATTNGKFRSLLVGVHRGDHFVYVGRVGTGYGARKVEMLLPKLKALETARSPFTGIGAPKKQAEVGWLKPEPVAEIEFEGWTADGLVRQAAFKGLREDEPAKEIRAEKPASPATTDTAEPAATAKTRLIRSKGARAEVMGVLISNPDKPLWPDAGDVSPSQRKSWRAIMKPSAPPGSSSISRAGHVRSFGRRMALAESNFFSAMRCPAPRIFSNS